MVPCQWLRSTRYCVTGMSIVGLHEPPKGVGGGGEAWILPVVSCFDVPHAMVAFQGSTR